MGFISGSVRICLFSNRMRRIKLKKILLFFIVLLGIFLIQNILSDWKNLSSETDEDPSDSQVKIDWANYETIDEETVREGAGEQGTGVHLTAEENEKAKQLMEINGFNALVSDKISVHRSVKDLRINKCKWLKYDNFLPQASIIIPFHNEHWSTLLRTVHSLLYRSPDKLVKEIILVDDNSTKEFLGEKLDQYVSEHFTKVRILRTGKREGLIRARLIGANYANGTVLIFIDSHCEVGINWLPPLLQPIREHYKTVSCPFIDVISYNDFSLRPQDEGGRGAFDWNFDYKRLPRLHTDNAHPEKPFDSPIMAGGLFAISKLWFNELGGYDDGLDVWGGEQYELSFKVWMCGGKMVDVPCSRIGHVYRKFNPFGVRSLGNYIARNHKRVAEVWMDDWKQYIYQKHHRLYSSLDTGDLTKQKQLRKTLNCTSFDWFMKHIAYDLLQKYPIQKTPVDLSQGKIKSEINPHLCFDFKFGNSGDPFQISNCSNSASTGGGDEQNLAFTWEMEIKPRQRDICLDYPRRGETLMLFSCHGFGGNQQWIYNQSSHQIVHVVSKKCIDYSYNPRNFDISIRKCSREQSQKWILENMNAEIASYLWKEQNL